MKKNMIIFALALFLFWLLVLKPRGSGYACCA
jgi:hypothetical protein